MERRETAFRNNLVKELKALGYFACAVESESTELGISDAYAFIHKKALWIECKYVLSDEEVYNAIAFRPGQERFLRQHADAGGYGFVCIRTPDAMYFTKIEDVNTETKRPKHVLKITRLCYLELFVQWLDTFTR